MISREELERPADTARFGPQRPFDVQHVQPALEHVDERAHLVIRGDELAGLRDGLQREFVFARHFGNVVEFDRQQLAVGVGADRLLGDDLHLAGRGLKPRPHGNIDVDVAVDPNVAGDGQLVLDEHVGSDHKVLDGDIAGLAQPARLAEGKREHGIAEAFEPGSGGLRGQIVGGIGPLRAVAQQHHPQQPLARLAPKHFLDRRPDSGLAAIGLVGKLDRAPSARTS